MSTSPLTASFLDDPYPLYRQLRDERPVHCDSSLGTPIWLLTRHDDVSAALTDWHAFSSEQGSATLSSAFAMRNREGGVQMIESDPPRHDGLRATVKAHFSPKRVRAFEDTFRQTAAGLLERIGPQQHVDVAAEFAWPLTLRVGGDLIGVPEKDRAMVLGWYQDVVYSGSADVATRSAISYGDYFCDLATRRLTDPADDLVSDLMQQVGAGSITRADAVLLCMDLFEGCVDVPANLIGNAVLALGSAPDQRRWLADPDLDPSALRLAIEELARFDTPIQYLPRVTTRDVELHGETIPDGSRVRLVLAAANRDERHYEDPDRLDLTRPALKNVAFGVGVHFCIGAPLARLGVGVAVPMLLRALGDYAVTQPVARPRGADIMRALLNLDVQVGGRTAAGRGFTVAVDRDRCESHGQCTLAAPDVFTLDDRLDLHYVAEPDESRRPAVERAAQVCPTQAIRVVSADNDFA